MALCENPISAGCPWSLAANSTAGVLPESMIQLHIIVPAVTVFGLIVLGTLLGLGIYVLRRPYAMAEFGVVEGGKGKWYEDSESGSDGTVATPTEERVPPQSAKQQQQPRERTEVVQQQQRVERDKELPPLPLQLRQFREATSVQHGQETELEIQEGMAGMSMEVLRASSDTALVWANFGPPPPKMQGGSTLRVPSAVISSPPPPVPAPLLSPPIPSSQRPATRSLVPPPRPYREPKRNTYPNQQPLGQIQPPPHQGHAQPRNLTPSHSQPEMRQRERHQPQLPHEEQIHTRAQSRSPTQSCSQPEMRRPEMQQRDRGTMVVVTRLEYPGETGSKLERPGLGLVIRQSCEHEQPQVEKQSGNEKERERLVRGRRFSVSQNF